MPCAHISEKLIGTVPLGERTEIRAVLSVSEDGRQGLDIRQWWRPEGENSWVATKKEINIPASRKADLIRALQGGKTVENSIKRKKRARRYDKSWAKKEGRKYGIYSGDDPNDKIPPWL